MMTEADEAAYAHWYEAAQTAQREVARLTAERDEAQRELSAAFGLPPTIGPAPGEGKRIVDQLRAELTRVIAERDDARSKETHRFALRRELEEALGVGDSYADGALEAALARIAVLRTVEADRDRLRRELDEALAGREREYARAEAEHDAAARIASEWAAASGCATTLAPCPRCWGPMFAFNEVCAECAPARDADELDDEARQMPGGAT